MRQRQSLALSKPFMLVLMGLSLGFSLNLLLSSLLSNQCNSIHDQIVDSKSNDREEHYELHYKSKNEIENDAILNSEAQNHRIVRPRFLSSELGLKEKLLISVLTSKDTLETFGVAINRTMIIPNAKSKLMFFMNGIIRELSSKMHLVMFSEVDKHLIPFFMLKYLADNFLQVYNWFYIFPDSTFINRENLEDFLDHISVGDDLIIGKQIGINSSMCDFDAGILLSRSALIILSKNIQWCMKSSSGNLNHSQNIERCLQYSMSPLNLSCSSQINKLSYHSLKFDEADNTIEEFTQNDVISFSHAASDLQIYKLFRKLSENNKKILDTELSKLVINDKRVQPFAPSENISISWPLGSEMNSQAKNRFDVLRWHYLNGSHIFHDRFQENLKPLRGLDKFDVSDILKEAMIFINKNELFPFTLEKFINGYRRFDASRGMEYIIDVILRQENLSSESRLIMKRIHMIKILGFAEVVPTPYVNENTPIQLLLTVRPDESNDVLGFVESFIRTCVEPDDNSFLVIAFVYETPDQQSNDIYRDVKSSLTLYDKKFRDRRISWISVVSNIPERLMLDVMDSMEERILKDLIVLMCTVDMELKIDFLNHVRMNTILGSQVYFPIGYLSYKPHLVYDKPPFLSSILINQKSGYYSTSHYDYASFYFSDYQYCKSQMLSIGAETRFVNLFEMFVRYHSINVFRAIDPALRMRFRTIKCLDHRGTCANVKYQSLASRSQLAMLLFEYLQNENRFEVMHD